MGREVYTEIRKNGKVLWDSAKNDNTYICGRNEETDALFRFITDEENSEIDISTKAQRDPIIKVMDEIDDRRTQEYNDLDDLINELVLARRNVRTVDEFFAFTAEINERYQYLRETYWGRANEIKRMIQRTVDEANRIASIGWCHNDDPDFVGAGLQLVIIWGD